MKGNKLKGFLFYGIILICCVLSVRNVIRIVNRNKPAKASERIVIRIPREGVFNLCDSLKKMTDSYPCAEYNYYMYLDGKSCASCWVGQLIDIQEYYRDSLPDIKPYLMFNIADDLKSFQRREFFEAFGDFGSVILDFDKTIANDNEWILANGPMSYGIITDSLNNILSCRLLFDPVFLSESKRYYESSKNND